MKDKIQIKWERGEHGEMCRATLHLEATQNLSPFFTVQESEQAKRHIENDLKEFIMRKIQEPIESRKDDLMRMIMTLRKNIKPLFCYDPSGEEILKPLMDLLNDYKT